MDNRNLTDLGEQIESIVHEAVDKLDFDKLNSSIGKTIDSALGEVQNQLQRSQQRKTMRYEDETRRNQAQENLRRRRQEIVERTGRSVAPRGRQQMRAYRPPNNLPIARSPKGRISGALCTFFGGISAVGFTAAFIPLFLMSLFSGDPTMITAIVVSVFLPLLACSYGLLFNGKRLRGRAKRFKEYVMKINGRTYCSIKELADRVGKSEKFVVRDLRNMIEKRMFLEGTIDDEETCLMLTYEVQEQYRHAQESQMMKQQEALAAEQRTQVEEKAKPAAEEPDHESENILDAEIKRVISEGRDCIRQIKEANAMIPDQEITAKLYRLENVISKIFNHIEEHPDQMFEIEKFMEYYLPTTLKLVDTYKTLDAQSIQKENISTAKQEIEKTLDTINTAFENLLDSLFANVALDITTDISVLETMLAREGLTKKDFSSHVE